MTIAFELEFRDLNKDKYDAIVRELGFDKKDAPLPEGQIEHTAGPTENGWQCSISGNRRRLGSDSGTAR